MTPDDIAHLVWSDSPAVSPDGTQVAYVVRSLDGGSNEYRSQIWLTAADGSARPRPVTSGRHRENEPCWSPDGTMLAFTAQLPADDGTPPDERQQSIQVLPFDGPGQAAVVASGQEELYSLSFSPDGRWLAYVTRTRDAGYEAKQAKDRAPRKIESLFATLDGEGFIVDRPEHVYVVPTNGSAAPRNLTPGSIPKSMPSWFPDSATLAVFVDPAGADLATHIEVISLDPTRSTDSTDSGDEESASWISAAGGYHAPSVAPDGTRVALIGYDDHLVYPQNSHVGLIGVEPLVTPHTGSGDTDRGARDDAGSEGGGTEGAAGRPEWITTAIDRTWDPLPGTRPAIWLSDDRLLAELEDHGSSHLYSIGADAEPELVAGGERMIASWDAAGGTIAFAATDPTMPTEIHSIIDGVERRLTDHTDAFCARVKPRAADRFTAPSAGPDGDVEVDVWLFTPHDFDPSQRYPMLVNVHGGPFTQYGDTFFDEVQLQCAAGYVVVLSNPRGGSGRDTAWGQAILGPKHKRKPGTGWGSVDFDDVMAVTDAALERCPSVDPERVGILGGSYGGYMTSWAVTHTDRFAAACSERSANNLLTLDYGSDASGFFWTEIGPTVYEDPEEYLRMSPISYVENLATPLLILHSEDDLRCPVEQANQLFVACLQMGKKDVEFHRFPGETHELSRSGSPTHRRQRAELILSFFDRYLKPADESDDSDSAG
ncbi:MAG: S9 family peptidase [Acidimicrobiales bacterium]